MESTIKKGPAPSSPYQPTPTLSPSGRSGTYLQGAAEPRFQPKAASTEPFLPPPYSPTPNVMIVQQPQNQRASWKNQNIVIIFICVIIAIGIVMRTIYYVAMKR